MKGEKTPVSTFLLPAHLADVWLSVSGPGIASPRHSQYMVSLCSGFQLKKNYSFTISYIYRMYLDPISPLSSLVSSPFLFPPPSMCLSVCLSVSPNTTTGLLIPSGQISSASALPFLPVIRDWNLWKPWTKSTFSSLKLAFVIICGHGSKRNNDYLSKLVNCVMLRIEPGTSCMIGTCSIPEL